MKIDLSLLEREKRFKTLYLHEGHEILSNPLTFPEYERWMQEHPEFPDHRDLYRSHGFLEKEQKNRLQNGEVAVARHERYGYPILHSHEYVELVYVYSGTCTHFIEGQSFEMKDGDLCFISPSARHAIVAVEDDAFVLNILLGRSVIDGDFLQMLRVRELLSDFFENILYQQDTSPYILFPTGSDAWMHDTVELMYHEYEKKDFAYEKAILLYVKQILLHVARHYQEAAIVAETGKKDGGQNAIMAACLTYLAANYNHVTLKEMAAKFGYNETHMSRKLKDYTGKTFQALITEMQMIRAVELLQAGGKSISEIAQEVGCFDSSHFTRKFKKYYGVAPGEYHGEKYSGSFKRPGR